MHVFARHFHIREDAHPMYTANSRYCALTRRSMGCSCQRVSTSAPWKTVRLLTPCSELEVKVVNIADTYRVLYLRGLSKPVKHLSYDPSGTYIAASCTDGIVYLYSLSTEEPEIVRKIDGLIRTLETESELSSRAVWHPDGRAFAAPTAPRDIQVVSSGDGERQRAFSGGHMGDVTALAWSPNGALLITAASDRKILLWDTKTQKVLAR